MRGMPFWSRSLRWVSNSWGSVKETIQIVRAGGAGNTLNDLLFQRKKAVEKESEKRLQNGSQMGSAVDSSRCSFGGRLTPSPTLLKKGGKRCSQGWSDWLNKAARKKTPLTDRHANEEVRHRLPLSQNRTVLKGRCQVSNDGKRRRRNSTGDEWSPRSKQGWHGIPIPETRGLNPTKKEKTSRPKRSNKSGQAFQLTLFKADDRTGVLGSPVLPAHQQEVPAGFCFAERTIAARGQNVAS